MRIDDEKGSSNLYKKSFKKNKKHEQLNQLIVGINSLIRSFAWAFVLASGPGALGLLENTVSELP